MLTVPVMIMASLLLLWMNLALKNKFVIYLYSFNKPIINSCKTPIHLVHFPFIALLRSKKFIRFRFSSEPFDSPKFKDSCNEACHCSPRQYDPVCGTDNVVYYSPCFAGCRSTYQLDSTKVSLTFRQFY